jgi:hypothetical protein
MVSTVPSSVLGREREEQRTNASNLIWQHLRPSSLSEVLYLRKHLKSPFITYVMYKYLKVSFPAKAL